MCQYSHDVSRMFFIVIAAVFIYSGCTQQNSQIKDLPSSEVPLATIQPSASTRPSGLNIGSTQESTNFPTLDTMSITTTQTITDITTVSTTHVDFSMLETSETVPATATNPAPPPPSTTTDIPQTTDVIADSSTTTITTTTATTTSATATTTTILMTISSSETVSHTADSTASSAVDTTTIVHPDEATTVPTPSPGVLSTTLTTTYADITTIF